MISHGLSHIFSSDVLAPGLASNESLSVDLGHAVVLAGMGLQSSWVKCGQSRADGQGSAPPQLILGGFNMSCGKANLCDCYGNKWWKCTVCLCFILKPSLWHLRIGCVISHTWKYLCKLVLSCKDSEGNLCGASYFEYVYMSRAYVGSMSRDSDLKNST